MRLSLYRVRLQPNRIINFAIQQPATHWHIVRSVVSVRSLLLFFQYFCGTEELYYTHIMVNKDYDQQTTIFFNLNIFVFFWFYLYARILHIYYVWPLRSAKCGVVCACRLCDVVNATAEISRIFLNWFAVQTPHMRQCPRQCSWEKVKNFVGADTQIQSDVALQAEESTAHSVEVILMLWMWPCEMQIQTYARFGTQEHSHECKANKRIGNYAPNNMKLNSKRKQRSTWALGHILRRR